MIVRAAVCTSPSLIAIQDYWLLTPTACPGASPTPPIEQSRAMQLAVLANIEWPGRPAELFRARRASDGVASR